MLSAIAALLPFLASAQAYFILSHPILTTTRLDPIVNPGAISSHVHSIVGGSNFDKSMSYASARQSSCTTAPVTEDKSNYWTPQLYYYKPADQSYQAIPVAGVNTYYLPRAGADGKVQAFPDGLRMVSGSPNRRSFNNDADSKAVTFVCLDYSGSHQNDPDWAERNSFFTHNCPNGMRAQIFFRSCWDGVNLDSPDHVSHMAWPSGGVDGGECPSTHPIRLVSLFYEYIYNVQNFPFNDPQYPTWVLANGDTTGYGFHGDFLNGWPAYNNGTNILQQAINGCNQNNGVGGELNNCPPFVPFLNSGAANACGPQNLLVNENVGFGSSIPQLPGNNPIWIGNGTKPSYANYTDPATNFTNFKSVIPTGYTETGCIAEGTSGRALNALYWSSPNMTRGACVSYCQSNGFPLAGVQYGQECRCDTAMRNGGDNTTLLDSSRCNMKCAGNSYENCGGSAVMNLFNNPSMYVAPTLPAGWTGAGCYSEVNGRALSAYSFATQSMTQSLCISTCASKGYTWAGAEYSQECYCGNSVNAGSGVVSDEQCNMPCKGDITTTCGGPSRLTVFQFNNVTVSTTISANASTSTSAAANSTVPASPASTTNVTSSSVVSSAAMTSSTSTAANTTSPASSTTSSAVTSSVNATSNANGASSANVTSSSASTATAVLLAAPVTPNPNASSSITSSSSSSVAPSTSSSSSSSSTSASASASPSPSSFPLPSGWTANGCMTEAGSVRALAGYSSSWNLMTPQACINACQQRGFKYAGVEYGRECYCGDAFSAGSTPAADSSCNAKCGGDSSQICGGPNRLTTFVSSNPRPAPQLPVGWQSTGCYTELNHGRALGAASITSDQMTVAMCVNEAVKRGYTYAGLEYGRECYMANSINGGSSKVDDSKCQMSCAGDLAGRCGGSKLLSVYNTAAAAPVSSVSPSASSSPKVRRSRVAV